MARHGADSEARAQGLAGLVRLLMGQLGEARGGAGQKYATGDETIDESVTPGARYPLHRLERSESLRGLAAREAERVRGLRDKIRLPHAGQVRNRAQMIDEAVDAAQRGTPAAGPDRPTLEAELKRLRSSPKFTTDPVQNRIAEIKKLLAGMK